MNRPVPPTQIYEVEGLRFRGMSPSQMIADKVLAISADRVFRRVKDVVDMYLSKVFHFDSAEVAQTLKNSGKTMGSFHGFLYNTDELKHAYEKFRFEGNVHKPPFEEVFHTVRAYIKDVLPQGRIN